MKLIYAGNEYVLTETERNTDLLDDLRSRRFPGIATFDTNHGDLIVNLSESIPFVIRDNEFASGRRGKATVF